jgi:hypothetical protein
MKKGEHIRALLLGDKHTWAEIQRIVGCNKATISYHAARLGLSRPNAKYDWQEVQAYYDAGHSVRETTKHFGMSSGTWSGAVSAGKVKARETAIPLEDLLREEADLSRGNIKRRLIREKRLAQQCAECGLTEWRGQAISLEIDHVNGDRNDWRMENLRLLCPNCHSQTSTYGGRNKARPSK